MSKDFSEDSRVKVPALIHLTRLGYEYLSTKDLFKYNDERNEYPERNVWDFDLNTNIIKQIFCKQFFRLNNLSESNPEDISIFEREFINIQIELNQPDLGRSFYNRIIGKGTSEYKIIDFENFEKNNTFHIATEVTCKNGDDNFRPDITVFINGLPLSFIEVKKPNNNEGIKAERDRMNDRMQNDKFRRFLNITQFMIFSNNEEYDDNVIGQDQLAGAFYATISNSKIRFNNFRETEAGALSDKLKPINEELEDSILKDTNLTIIKNSSEFKDNKNPLGPTNRILSSFFTKSRLKFRLQYGLVYVDEVTKDGQIDLQKHIMRYPQFFATKAIKEKLESGVKKGIIWHTQGSGKTALSYYNFKYLKDYFGRKNIATKFYFIVDRLDLLKQAKNEFIKRGASVKTIDNKESLIKDMKNPTASDDMTIVNIQKFSEDASVIKGSYDLNVQRIFFIDEAHRSYDPKGSFLANLYNADQDSIKIALTGTPLIVYKKHEQGDDDQVELVDREDAKTTKNIFGDYIHKYYYNDSIKDGFTVRLIREEIQTEYKEKINKTLKALEQDIKKGLLKTKNVMAHPNFVQPMLEYILDDFDTFRIRYGDKSVGGMVVCNSSEQAREMYKQFKEKQENGKHQFTGSLILCNEGSKDSRNEEIQSFKDGKTDFLFVCAMLLTGFDAPRLKKMYLGRQIKAHTLLQALTRVNRPYHQFSFGYVVDFADISEQFEITNQAYLRELNEEYEGRDDGNNVDFSALFLSEKEINDGIESINNTLINYDTTNKENFVKEISDLSVTKEELTTLRKALEQARDLYNIARLTGRKELVEKLDIKLLSKLLICVTDRIRRINQQEALSDIDSTQLLNLAMENSIFSFSKIGEEQLSLTADDLDEESARVARALTEHRFEKDIQWVSFMAQYREILRKIGSENLDMDGLQREKKSLRKLFDEISYYNSIYSRLTDKFRGDKKYAYMYKKIVGSGNISENTKTIALYKAFLNVKDTIDDKLLHNQGMLKTKSFFANEVGVCMYDSFKQAGYECNVNQLYKMRDELVDEYYG